MSGHATEPEEADVDVLMVARHDQLHQLTLEGWRLVESLPNASEVETRSVTMTPAHANDNGTWMSEIRGEQAFVVVRPLFVLTKSSKVISRETQLQQLLVEADTRDFDRAREVKNAKANFDELAPVLKQREEQKAQLEAQLANIKQDLFDKINHVGELEKLLARIRKEVGEAQWRHLIGSHASCITCIERGEEIVDPLSPRVKGPGGT